MEWWVWAALALDIAFILVLYAIYGRGGGASHAVAGAHADAAHAPAALHAPVHEPAHAPVAAPAPHPEPDPAPAPAPAAPDDLALVEGIGPRINQVLQDAGIRTFADLAAASVEHIQDVLKAASLPLANPETWAQQAALAAEGRMDALKELQDSLNAGRTGT